MVLRMSYIHGKICFTGIGEGKPGRYNCGRENKKKENKRDMFLEELAKHTRDPDVLRDAALNVLLAGRDTTASSLAWAFYHLAKDITIQRRLRKILRGQFCNSETGEIEGMTFEGLKRCKYLQYVIKETLQLHPPVPVNVRTATCDTTLPRGGYCKKMAGDWQRMMRMGGYLFQRVVVFLQCGCDAY